MFRGAATTLFVFVSVASRAGPGLQPTPGVGSAP